MARALKFLESCLFRQERLATLKRQGHLQSATAGPAPEPAPTRAAAAPVNAEATTPKHAGTRSMPCSPDEDDSPLPHPDTQLSQRSMNRSRTQPDAMKRASLSKKPFQVPDAQVVSVPKARPSAGERSLTVARSGGSPHSSVTSSVDEEEESLLHTVHHRVDTTPTVNGEAPCEQKGQKPKYGVSEQRSVEESSLLTSPFAAPLSFLSKFFQQNSSKAPRHMEAPETTAKV